MDKEKRGRGRSGRGERGRGRGSGRGDKSGFRCYECGAFGNFANEFDKNHLYPAAPPLTPYKETMFPIVKKKVLEGVLLDDEVDEKLKGLTTVKLCVRLNSLEYMQKQINILEVGIKKSWASIMLSGNTKLSVETTNYLHSDSESVDELFVDTLDIFRDSTADAIRKLLLSWSSSFISGDGIKTCPSSFEPFFSRLKTCPQDLDLEHMDIDL
ncbi:hypothetical protein E3N88_07671 [Mikania micrantha]|uniref:Uncharacterized protein n=1 Tax=Mikania micrantha TaxID=192012 RepID=A0A5N6PGA8_9ASTR|nr:hypothetical protein E3N88_07671 [Mikania micrantha]